MAFIDKIPNQMNAKQQGVHDALLSLLGSALESGDENLQYEALDAARGHAKDVQYTKQLAKMLGRYTTDLSVPNSVGESAVDAIGAFGHNNDAFDGSRLGAVSTLLHLAAET